MKNWLQKFMLGRYGVDQLSNALITLSLVLILLSIVLEVPLLNSFGLVFLGVSYYRILSRNTGKRYIENQKFLNILKPLKGKMKNAKNMGQKKVNKDKNYKYFKCPKCSQEMRVPKGKGRVNITCPKCKNVFIRKT